MPGFIDIAIVGDASGVQAMLYHLEQKLLPPMMSAFLKTQVEPYIEQRAKARFAGEGDDVVGQWAPLQAITEQIRAQQGYGSAHPINRRTGELENYITNSGGDASATPLGATLIYPGTPASGELADKVSTAQIGRDNSPTVPRPVLGMNETDLAAVLTMLAYQIEQP